MRLQDFCISLEQPQQHVMRFLGHLIFPTLSKYSDGQRPPSFQPVVTAAPHIPRRRLSQEMRENHAAPVVGIDDSLFSAAVRSLVIKLPGSCEISRRRRSANGARCICNGSFRGS